MNKKPWKVVEKDGEIKMVDGITQAFIDLGFTILHDELTHAEATEKFLKLKEKKKEKLTKKKSKRTKKKKKKFDKYDDSDDPENDLVSEEV